MLNEIPQYDQLITSEHDIPSEQKALYSPIQ